MTLFTLTDLINKNIHLGYNKEYLNSKTNKFIYKIISKNSILDIIQTAEHLSKAYSYFYMLGFFKLNILFIGSNPQFNSLIQNIALSTGNFYYNRSWIPGTLTNWNMIKNRLLLLQWISTLLENTEFNSKLSYNIYSKVYKIYKKLNKNLKGLIGLIEIPEIIFILDTNYDKIAFREAKILNKIIISTIDNRINPEDILIPISSNNLNHNSLSFIFKLLAAGYIKGLSDI